MADFTNILGVRIFISCIGSIGNLILIFSITHSHAKISSMKSFEVFLLGLAVSNLEEILVVNIYDIVILEDPSTLAGNWSCRLLKFLTIAGELGSILFTVVICIFRYEKVRHATERGNRPTPLDNVISALFISGFCFVLALSLSTPVFVTDLNVHTSAQNSTKLNCPLDFFHCHKPQCSKGSYTYKYIFIVICNIVPMCIVTVTSCLIISALLHQKKRVEQSVHVSGSRQFGNRTKSHSFYGGSTVAVLAAMGLFQVDWSLYLFLQLNLQTSNLAFWNEMKFFVSTSYTSISPYVFGIGNDLFSIKRFTGK